MDSRGTCASCAILDDDTTKCWGYHLGGAIGSDDLRYRGGSLSMSQVLPLYFP